jgi:energy-coupling factor transport system substrate-specific component
MSAAAAVTTPGLEPVEIGTPRARLALLVAANVVGILAFLWPFVLPALAGPTAENHKADGPWILLGLGAILAALLFLELGRGGMGPKVVALIGVLGAAIVALRLPGYVAGFSAMFIVVLVAGNAFGPSFGFLLGAVGMFASGLFVGGLGPWLPFEMMAFGWVGAGAGLLPGAGSPWRVRIPMLAAYGAFAGLAYGAVMNLWTWPFIADGSAIAWNPSGGLAINVRHYAAYYLVSSLAWDLARAIGNAVLVLALGQPLLRVLDRAARRMRLTIA